MCCQEFLAVVSIPHRRATNEFKTVTGDFVAIEFQFLIGELQTPRSVKDLELSEEFQFLIGELQTNLV